MTLKHRFPLTASATAAPGILPTARSADAGEAATASVSVPSLVSPGEFPLIDRERAAGRVYLDSAATTQKPNTVLAAEATYYRETNANVHRGIHRLSVRATDAFEGARSAVALFIGASRPEEIIFCRGATEALNMVAHGWGTTRLKPGDEIVLTSLEHHSNLVPWQMAARRTGARLVELKPDASGSIGAEALARAVGPRTRILGMTHVANLLGTVNDLAAAAEAARRVGALFLVDGAQAVGHMPVDVGVIGCDLYAASGHKMFGPTGTGFLYGRHDLLDTFDPFLGGGDMIESVRFEEATYANLPARLEPGTPNIAGFVGLGAAVAYLEDKGMTAVRAHDVKLVDAALERLLALPWLEVYGPRHSDRRSGLLSFNVRGIHAHDVGSVLDAAGVAVRTGHMCAQPTLQHLGVGSCVRASFALYNDTSDVDRLVDGLQRAAHFFGVVG